MNGLALFAGGGGLELGLSLALGTHYKPIAYVEREATSAAVLAANMERGWLDKAPVWDDVTTFTGDVVSPLVDNIDIVTAGFPCQPWSVAGQRKGTDDERWLWPLIFRLVREIRPRSIFLENVAGLLHGGIEHVLGDLASVGFDAEWTSVRASDVGAPHRRERVFILAVDNNQSGGRKWLPERRVSDAEGRSTEPANSTSERPREAGQHIERPAPRTSSDRTALGNTKNVISQRQQPEGTRTGQPEEATGDRSGNVGDTRSERLEGTHDHASTPRRVQQSVAERCGELDDTDSQRFPRWGRHSERGNEWIAWPPSPSDSDTWSKVDGRFYPAKPDVRGVANGLARELARPDKLRILGNGVVPQQAALAYSILSERLERN